MSSVSCDQSHICMPTLVGWWCLKRSPNLLSDPARASVDAVCMYVECIVGLLECMYRISQGAGKVVTEGGKNPSLVSHLELAVPLPPHYLPPPLIQVREVSCSSPGGTSIHGLEVLEQGGLRASLMGAIKRSIERAQELRPRLQNDQS